MNYRIIVAHPGKQHSYRLASALKKSDMLSCYITTVYDKKSSLLMKIIKVLLSSDNLKRANNRRNLDLDDNDVVQFLQFRGILEIVLSRMDRKHTIYRILQRKDADRFGLLVAKKAIKEKVDAVIMYDSNSLAGFEYLKKNAPEIIRIQDVSIVPRPYMKKIYQAEIENSGHIDLKIENEYLWNDFLLKRFQEEINYTQYFLAASQFVKSGLVACGVNDSQVKVVPYGANVGSFIEKKKKRKHARIEFLFVGQVIYRKGISYLLECMEAFQKSANLTVVGAYDDRDWFVKESLHKDNIVFTGLVTFDKMKDIYEKADVFVIPSFAEGMAQVGIEAMACGLPVICTFNSGLADLVENNVNGFIIPCGSREALQERMKWFIEHKDMIKPMGETARQIAQKYTWENYEKNVVAEITKMLNEKQFNGDEENG